jgi:alcohol dehydrogenase
VGPTTSSTPGTRGFGGAATGFAPNLVVIKELRVIGAPGGMSPHTAPRSTCSGRVATVRQPPRRIVGLEEVEELLATMAGERDAVPPVHGVLTP